MSHLTFSCPRTMRSPSIFSQGLLATSCSLIVAGSVFISMRIMTAVFLGLDVLASFLQISKASDSSTHSAQRKRREGAVVSTA